MLPINRLYRLPMLLLFFAVATGPPETYAELPLKITVLYDNTVHLETCQADWGFACLVEGMEKIILFDAGTKGDILLANAGRLQIDLARVGFVAISHTHGDHTGGLQAALPKMQGVMVYLPVSAPAALAQSIRQLGAVPVRQRDPVSVFRNVSLTGEMGNQIREQALVIGTSKGLVVLTGCSHPGIVPMIEKAREVRNDKVYAVIGGFHLLQHSEADVDKIIVQIKQLGVQKVGATHCTGASQIEQFRKAYGANFLEMGVGQVIRLE